MNKVEKIKAEIERLKSSLPWGSCASQISMECNCKNEAYNEVLSYINSLEEEPVSNDLEEAATSYVRKQLSNPDYPTYNDEYEMECAFEAGAQWQKNQAVKWLKENKDHPFIKCEDPCLSGYLTDEFIEDFKKAMEE